MDSIGLPSQKVFCEALYVTVHPLVLCLRVKSCYIGVFVFVEGWGGGASFQSTDHSKDQGFSGKSSDLLSVDTRLWSQHRDSGVQVPLVQVQKSPGTFRRLSARLTVLCKP